AGTLKKSAGTSVATIGVTNFTNSGTGSVLEVDSGSVTIANSFTNNGTITLKSTGVTGTTLNVGGNLTLTPTSVVQSEIAGTGSFGKINVTGVADLQGTLYFSKTAGYTPLVNDAFPVITYGSKTGNNFSTIAALFPG